MSKVWFIEMIWTHGGKHMNEFVKIVCMSKVLG